MIMNKILRWFVLGSAKQWSEITYDYMAIAYILICCFGDIVYIDQALVWCVAMKNMR